MAKFSKDEIVAKAKDLAKMIAETEEVDFFKRAEAQIHENQKVRTNISTIKGLQKQAVNLQHYGKTEALKKTEDKIAILKSNWMKFQLFTNSSNHKLKLTIYYRLLLQRFQIRLQMKF